METYPLVLLYPEIPESLPFSSLGSWNHYSCGYGIQRLDYTLPVEVDDVDARICLGVHPS